MTGVSVVTHSRASMNLSAEKFREIIETLRSDCSDRDKRSGPRVGMRAQVAVLTDLTGRRTVHSMRCRNVSASGIGLMHTRELPVGAEFIVCLSGGGMNEPVYLSCVVVHCHHQGPDVYSIGGRIVRVLPTGKSTPFNDAAA